MKSILGGIFKFAGICSIIFCFSFLLGMKGFSAEPTSLHLDFQDGGGRPVKGVQATLILVAGAYVDKLPLEITTAGLDLPFDSSWLNKKWPGGASRLKNMDRAYVFLKAPGYASLCSSPIHWMGTETGGLGKNVVVSFPGSKVMVVTRGKKFSSVLNFRKPTERYVKLSSHDGKPVAGVKVKTYVFWSKTDQGDLNGADYLGEGFSDPNGRVSVVDGDFTYAIQVLYKDNPAGNILIVKRFEDKEYPVTLP